MASLSTILHENRSGIHVVKVFGSAQFEEEKFDVTVEMIAETLATEFPEFMLVIAEENWIRGYKQGLDDAEKLYSKQTTE